MSFSQTRTWPFYNFAKYLSYWRYMTKRKIEIEAFSSLLFIAFQTFQNNKKRKVTHMAIYYLWKMEKRKNKNGSIVITGEILNIWGHYGNTFNK